MTKLILTMITLCVITSYSCSGTDEEAESIKNVINESYIDGIHNHKGSEVIRRGFHPGFEMLIFRDNQLIKMPLETWITNVEKQKRENTGSLKHPATARYLELDVTGNAAVVKLELYREGKRLFTDYLYLYKFNDGWKIVGKTFYKHETL